MLTWLVRVLEMIRFSHTIFAMPFALLAAVMADHDENLIAPARICIHGEIAGTVSSSLIALLTTWASDCF